MKKITIQDISRTVRTKNEQRALIIGRLQRQCVWLHDIDRWLWMLAG